WVRSSIAPPAAERVQSGGPSTNAERSTPFSAASQLAIVSSSPIACQAIASAAYSACTLLRYVDAISISDEVRNINAVASADMMTMAIIATTSATPSSLRRPSSIGLLPPQIQISRGHHEPHFLIGHPPSAVLRGTGIGEQRAGRSA